MSYTYVSLFMILGVIVTCGGCFTVDPSYVDRLTATLEKLISDADKSSSMSRLMVTRRLESVEEQQSLEPQLDLVRRRTKELQKQVCRVFEYF